jgi:superfamily II DNA or RNA helicase/HKD family nuclease/SOS-response transcriptional repressor LexA
LGQFLTTGGERDPFLPKLLETIHRANQIDLAVAFVKNSGLQMVFPALLDAVETRTARLRVLTSDYLDVTDPRALRRLLLLVERGADVRVFQSEGRSFHLKTYICVHSHQGEILWGSAFVGSSNLSRTALTEGLEWNLRVDRPDDTTSTDSQRFKEIREQYEILFDHPQVRPLEHEWVEQYEQRRQLVQRLPVAPDGDEPEEPPPQPTDVQQQALNALNETREAGYRRGLVVMATGLGKTFLAAFDSRVAKAKRILFVAHREEILIQAESSFLLIHEHKRVGRYSGKQKDNNVDLLFASVQTLGQSRHLERFSPEHFDYVVIDEFHHAAAPIYRRLIQHFRPRFLLGLTATPDRTDQSDILSLCDDNLVYSKHLFDGVRLELLCPFRYFGIHDETVDYQAIPWRNGRFDPEALTHKLATFKRARHVLNHWRQHGQRRTLAFCASRAHADFMSERFLREGVPAAAVYQGSALNRSAALDSLSSGTLQVIFSVDLFNEGIDLPAIDTILMLRPTESKVLFLQQFGRGLRRHPEKKFLVVLDFIGNHRSFLHKPQALFEVGSSYGELTAFARRARDSALELPPGCFVDYDLTIVDFLARLQARGPAADYQALKESLGRRPSLTELYRSGAKLPNLRHRYGQWWSLLREQGDLSPAETVCFERHSAFFRELETTTMVRCFKGVLLESFLEIDGFRHPPTVEELAAHALDVFRRRRRFIVDIRKDLQDIDNLDRRRWIAYWTANPVNAFTGGNLRKGATPWFALKEGRFQARFQVEHDELDTFQTMVQELVDYRLAAYEPRLPAHNVSTAPAAPTESNIVRLPPSQADDETGTDVPYFPDLGIACGYFRSGRTDVEETYRVPAGFGNIDPQRHFVARAVGNSMNGGKNPVRDGDYLLLERLDPTNAGSISGAVLAIERQDGTDDNHYVLRRVTKTQDGRYVLKASNPDYPDFEAEENMRTLARLRAILPRGD